MGAGLLATGVIAGLLCAWEYTVDDAYIVGRYARHLAQGLGYTMNPGQGPTDGVTGPLWLLPGVIAAFAGLDPVWVAKLVGGLCMAMAALLVVSRVRGRCLGTLAAPVAGLLFVVQPTSATWAVAGLETGAAAWLIAMTTVAAPSRAAVHLPALIAAAAISWLRPELVPTVAVLVLLPPLLSRSPRRRVLGWHGGALVLGLAAIAGFRLACFGDAWPLSVRAKPAELDQGLAYVARALPWVTGGGGLWLLGCAYRWGRQGDRIVVTGLATALASIALAGGDWMPGFRLFAPLVPVYAGLAGLGFARAYARGRRVAPLLALGLSLVAPAVDWAIRLPQLAEAADGREVAVGLARKLAGMGESMATVDVGLLAYASGLQVLDLGGITDPRIGDLPGGHLEKRVPQALLQARAPDLLVLHARTLPTTSDGGGLLSLSGYPVERRIASMPWVERNYHVVITVPYASNYHYVVMIAR